MSTSARIPMLAAAACAAAFAAVLILTPRVPAAGTADADTVRALTRLAGSWVGSLASIIAHSAAVMIPILLVAVLGWGAAAGRRRETVAAAALVGVAMAGAEVLKLALDQPRFRAILGLHELGVNNFPSGHATAVTGLAFAALLVAPRTRRRFALVAGGAYALSVCTSILVLGWHLPSDVLGGVLLSSSCFCATLAGLSRLRQRDGREADGD